MTIAALKADVSRALSDNRIDLREARALVAATGPGLSTAEAKVLGHLRDSFTGGAGQPGAPYGTSGARAYFDGVFTSRNLPFGANRGVVINELITFFDGRDLGQPLSKAPSVSSRIELVLNDRRPVDGTRETAFVPAGSGKIYLRVDGGGRANTGERWYGPFVKSAPTQDPGAAVIRTVSKPLEATWKNYLATHVIGVLNATANGTAGAATFSGDKLPDGGKFVDSGLRLNRGSRTISVFLVDDGRPAEAADRYFLRADGGGQPTKFAGPITLPAMGDPYSDGKLTFPNRAKNLYYRLSFDEHLHWVPNPPPSSVKLARGYAAANDATQYFVVPQKTDGTYDDPDKATEVYFRHIGSGQWSGPHGL